MDWEANLAAIIKCTDANLEQQFRLFEDVTAEFAADEAPGVRDPSENVASAYFRDSMASEYRHRQQYEKEQAPVRQTPSYARVSDAFARAPAPSAASSTTFSEHFHRRQERKRGAAAGRAKDNQRFDRRGSEYEPAEEEDHGQEHREVDEPRFAAARPAQGAYHQQMYSSPTYDIAQMMEQVRLSLKLEVDARAAIAERQLSALLQLCKATSEELDRLRVEVCANDRQLHTLDQVQSKIRQELTTQKDIGFHLQSMCGKDESWRMQTENQLLELRQMVAALREQGNSTQAVAQEKLSRSELLVQFNAAMEPIKAQLQANLQHQAQQIADVTRTTSSSSLLLDGITQKVNRGITDELNELRSDLSALKHHVAKMDIFQDGSRGLHGRSPALSKEEQEKKAKEEQQQQERRANELRKGLAKELTTLAKDYVDARTTPIRQAMDEAQSRFVVKRELETLQNTLEIGCRDRVATAVDRVDSQLKSAREQLQGAWTAAVRDATDRLEKSMQQSVNGTVSALEGQSSLWQSKQLELMRLFESEQKERKQALDELQEAVRKSRHQLEDQIHALAQKSRSQLAQRDCELEKRVKQVENQVEKGVVELQKETQATVAALKTTLQAQGGTHGIEWDQKLKRLEETVAATNSAVTALSKSVESSAAASSSTTPSDSSAKDASLALERQTNAYVSTMENLLQKMQLQLQLQAQSQPQMAMAPSPYHGYWPASPYAASPHPPPPTVQLPPASNASIAASSAEQSAVTPVKALSGKTPYLSSPAPSRLDSSVGADAEATGSGPAECLTSPGSVTEAQQLESPAPSNEARPLLATTTLPLDEKVPEEPNASNTADNLEGGPAGSTDHTSKRENTLATTAKGALAEAELAKARVESRRRQELETKQQRNIPVFTAIMKESSSIGIPTDNLPGSGSRRSSVPVVQTSVPSVKVSALTRSASSSTLPGNVNAASDPVKVIGAKDLTQTSPSRIPAVDRTSRSPVTATQQNVVRSPSQLPPPSPSAVLATTPQTCDVDPVPAPPVPAKRSDSLLASPRSNDPPPRPQKEPQAFTLPVPLPAQEEPTPPLSPLAKIFATLSEVRPAPNTSHETDGPPPPIAPLPTTVAGAATSPPVSYVLCGLCRLPVRSDHKSEHETSQCPKRMVECVACKQQLQCIGLEMHELECSSAHRATANETKSPPEGATEGGAALKKCRHCSADVPSLDLLEHEINCDNVLKQCPHCLRRQKMSELQDHIENCDCRLVSCPNDCGGKFLQRGIPNHVASRCPKKPVAAATAGGTAPPRTQHTETSKATSVPTATPPPAAFGTTGKVECKFCDDEVDASKIDDHEQSCDWKPKRCQHCNMVVISRDLMRHETSCKTNLKACPHCNENLPQSALTTHASRCSKRPIKCIRCCLLFPADAIVAHSTNCKFVPGTNPSAASTPSPLQNQSATSRAPIKIPPPPPFPPPSTAMTGSQQTTRRASADPRMNTTSSADTVKVAAPVEQAAGDRLARRNLALSQLTNPGAPVMSGGSTQHDRNSSTRASAPSLYPPAVGGLQPRPIIHPDGRRHTDDDSEEDEDEEDFEDDEDEQLTLAQVVKEWSVENVCLWLHEDVGVPDVVLRFQQKQCNGEMLLELTESDLINDFAVKDRVQRERILTAIDAIKTSDAFSDEDEDEEEDASEEDEDELDESEDYKINDAVTSPTTHVRHSIGGASYAHPRDILRRKSQPSPQRALGIELPSSNDMLRRISSALENPKR